VFIAWHSACATLSLISAPVNEMPMPARVFIWLILSVIAAAGVTIVATQAFGLPMALMGVGSVGTALAFRLWGAGK
jgi:hypothetical protein